MTDDQPARRELGRRLAAARKAGGYTQQELAAVTRYSRGTVSAAEVGGPEVGRAFWMRCDLVLGTGDAFALAFDEVRARERGPAAGLPAEVAGARPGDPGRAWHLLSCPQAAAALAGYRHLGWPVSRRDGRLELATGEVVDALELPLAPGLLAATLWLHSRGRADEAAGLPPLPDPAQSLAVITAGKRCFFLVASGCCPWASGAPARAGNSPVARAGNPGRPAGDPGRAAGDPGRAAGDPGRAAEDPGRAAGDPGRPAADPGRAAGAERGGPVIRWHADGGRILVPPSRLPGAGRAAWACLPALPMVPPPPAALLTLLATAAASASAHPAALTLPGGVRLVPASLESSSS
ncbi:MAG TPA: helix-turn-helix domain-containing protein [Streptosporangiaceae bacterium]|nr:helix-turn-helix domain-containing protein [Streptosporangiaceae bacterium]